MGNAEIPFSIEPFRVGNVVKVLAFDKRFMCIIADMKISENSGIVRSATSHKADAVISDELHVDLRMANDDRLIEPAWTIDLGTAADRAFLIGDWAYELERYRTGGSDFDLRLIRVVWKDEELLRATIRSV